MSAYYNEHDPYAAQWLRNLIAAGHIAPGDVDERSIIDVRADDIRGYTQCHWFAGIGGWSVALRLAGWDDERFVWSGSCPCQPFSAAGTGKAGDDERHLWPAWASLIRECRPRTVFGEQVEAAIGWGWLDLVFTDLEAEGYACGSAILPACGVGAPHIRNRVWFVAGASRGSGSHERFGDGPSGQHVGAVAGASGGNGGGLGAARSREAQTGNASAAGVRAVADADAAGLDWFKASRIHGRWDESSGGEPAQGRVDGPQWHVLDRRGDAGGLGDADGEREVSFGGVRQRPDAERGRTGPLGGFWSGAEWLPCSDGKARPVEPGSFPLAHGVLKRPSKLRAYGNAIVPQIAAEFVQAFLEAAP